MKRRIEMGDRKEMSMTLAAVVATLGTSLGVAAGDLHAAANTLQTSVALDAVQGKQAPSAVQGK
jgi:hypothetical protein